MAIETIIDALRKDECVLVLGPRAAMFEGEYLYDLLAERMAQRLRLPEGTPSDLAVLARQWGANHRNPTEALAGIGTLLSDFYQEFADEAIPVYEKAAWLPFKHVLNCTHEGLFEKALRGKDKNPSVFAFDFSNPDFNEYENKRAVHLEIDEDRPLVFNFLGHYDTPSSLVLTDADRLRFLDVVMQKEKGALPENISYHFLRKPLKRLRKTFLFLGFDFNAWHMRLFMHLLDRTQDHRPQSLTLQEQESLHQDAAVFYSDNFDMVFLPDNPERLLDDLHAELNRPVAPIRAAEKPELLLLYHPMDDTHRRELEIHLAPLRNAGLVELWQEDSIAPGDDQASEMQRHLDQASVILVLLTANLLADERRYPYIEQALDRHRAGEAKLVVLTYTPCAVQDTPLFSLNTLYPKPKGRAVSQKPDPAAALTSFAQELRGIIENISANPTIVRR